MGLPDCSDEEERRVTIGQVSQTEDDFVWPCFGSSVVRQAGPCPVRLAHRLEVCSFG
jgi:hypothetical protein